MTQRLLIIGIDPGYTGAIAFLEPDTMRLDVRDMPLGKSTTGKDELDLHALGSLLSVPDHFRTVVFLEKVHAMPKQGSSSTFRFGECFGALRMAVVGHGHEDRYVTPQAWKKRFRLSQDKGVSRSYAKSRFPAYADLFARVKDDGRAEAALIALFGMETLLPQLSSAA